MVINLANKKFHLFPLFELDMLVFLLNNLINVVFQNFKNKRKTSMQGKQRTLYILRVMSKGLAQFLASFFYSNKSG